MKQHMQVSIEANMSKSEQPPSEHKTAENERPKQDTYNPVNMAGRGKEAPLASDDEQPKTDDYNPVNMAGKKPAPVEKP
jgi:hypothetical protein